MQRIILLAFSFLLCNFSLSPPALAQDAQSKDQQPVAKAKKAKHSKSSENDTGIKGSSGGGSMDAELDRLLGKPVTPLSKTSIPGGVRPTVPSSEPSAGAPTEPGDQAGAGAFPSSNTDQPGGGSSNDTAPISQSDKDSDDGVSDDAKIPPQRIKAGELNNAAITAMNNKQFQKAIELFNQAVAADPTYTQGKNNLRVAYFNYGVELYNAGKYTEALPWIQKALAMAMAKQLNRGDEDMKKLYAECQEAIKETQKK